MATYYVELNGGDIAPKTELVGGVITPSVSFSGAQIYPTSGGGGTVTLQTKSVTYTPSTSQQTEQVTPDQGYDGLDKVNVTVDAVASGSVAVNNKQVTFTSPFSFNAATGKITSSSLYQNPITATVTPGYVDSAADGELTVYLNKTQQLDTVGATTYYPSTSDQTIATQQYLTGAQTIKGVTYSGLDAGNIKKDVVVKIGDSADDDRIVSVTGTYEGGGGGASGFDNLISPAPIDNGFGTMLAAFKDDRVKSGTITITSNFSNTTEALFLSTGLSQVHGFMLSCPTYSIGPNIVSGQSNAHAIFICYDLTNYPDCSMLGMSRSQQNATFTNFAAAGTRQDNAPFLGIIRFDGGDIYYTGRYNNNVNYQIVRSNVQYEWLAWGTL